MLNLAWQIGSVYLAIVIRIANWLDLFTKSGPFEMQESQLIFGIDKDSGCL